MPVLRGRRDGWSVNNKRVRRLWRDEGLQVPTKTKKKRLTGVGTHVGAMSLIAPNALWALDFQFDHTIDHRQVKLLNIIDEFTRECLTIRVARKLKGADVIDVLSDLFILRGVPGHVRSDNGPEFVAKAVQTWITAVGAKTAYIAPGSPWENGYVQLQAPRRAAEWGAVLQPRRGEDRHRELAPALQYPAPALEPRLQAARTTHHRAVTTNPRRGADRAITSHFAWYKISVRPFALAMSMKTVRTGTVSHFSWLRKICPTTSKYFDGPAQRAIMKPAAATTAGSVRNSRMVK